MKHGFVDLVTYCSKSDGHNVGFYLITMQAQRQNLRYPGYVWITQGWYSDQWWTEGDVNCTGEDLEFFVEGAIAISHFPTASNETEATGQL